MISLVLTIAAIVLMVIVVAIGSCSIANSDPVIDSPNCDGCKYYSHPPDDFMYCRFDGKFYNDLTPCKNYTKLINIEKVTND